MGGRGLSFAKEICFDGCQMMNSERLGLKKLKACATGAEGFHDREMHLLIHTLAFALQLNKSTRNVKFDLSFKASGDRRRPVTAHDMSFKGSQGFEGSLRK